ncbi:hypothetical protein [Parasitella parasitica]|uniref:Uncharacterized protein n=1 Tax=Parasitella parasitica TaxID=35722 RepID=A0A0B7NCW2_9FUNG|nr:hypothetical protein [Parasitella parasitica]
MDVLNKYDVASKTAPVVLSSVFTVVMSLKIFKEDGLGGIYNEDESKAMDWDEEDPEAHNPARVDIVMAELEADMARLRKTYNVCSDEQKVLFLRLVRFKYFSFGTVYQISKLPSSVEKVAPTFCQ